MTRIVVTGLSAITPIGNTINEFWQNLTNGVSGIGPITQFDASQYQVRIAGEVKGFDPSTFIDSKAVRRMARFTQFSVAGATMAVADAGISITESNAHSVGIAMNTGGGGIGTVAEEAYVLEHKGPRRVSPFFLPIMIPNMAACQVSITFGIKGPVHSATAACSSGIYAVIEGANLIKRDEIDVVIAGGVESAIIPLAFASLSNMGALSRRNDEPEKACRPFDLNRDGFVFAEGCGTLILERLEHAIARGARIYAEVAGGAINSDAFHVTAPEPTGSQAASAMSMALRNSGLSPFDIDYICAHGTGTPLNDVSETAAIKKTFGDQAYKVAISSPKSMVGHALGGAGAISSVATVLAIYHGVMPPTINLDTPDPECDLDYVPNVARQQKVHAAIANGFGFGGQNAVVAFKEYVE